MTVGSDCGPVVRPGDVLVYSCVYHRFDGEDVTDFHETCGLVARVVRDVGRTMEEIPNSVATVSSVDRQSKLISKDYPFSYINLEITLPTSLYIVPGLHIAIAFSKHS